jgi:hypothetical protein
VGRAPFQFIQLLEIAFFALAMPDPWSFPIIFQLVRDFLANASEDSYLLGIPEEIRSVGDFIQFSLLLSCRMGGRHSFRIQRLCLPRRKLNVARLGSEMKFGTDPCLRNSPDALNVAKDFMV